MQEGSSADAAICAPTTRSSCRSFRDKRPKHETRCVSSGLRQQQQQKQQFDRNKISIVFIFLQVKKLQVMLRQANDQLERTMAEKQNLEESVKLGNEETAAKVCGL